MIYILHQFLKSFALKLAHLLAAHAFFVGIPDHCFSVYLFIG